MKKMNLLFLTILGVLTISGCATNTPETKSTSSNESSTSQAIAQTTATIVITVDGKEVENKEVSFNEGDVLYDVMAANFEIEDQDGFINSIDGQSQDESAGKYWMYDLNGEMALEGAKDLVLKSGDTVLFKLEVMK
ncbi:DUF4430 domain-containing protein [Enterococcus alcedinis]|uniref:Transcobalamin-like C-terminal domain-containing protein n=1 Tax=Enterococcus alcedinis TaxID=1274384 RepID=A0A917JFP3_9ENTE|nr:DUF4430 domain-containing protein [Enterococcus alcedinis]MBP2101686.1 hypothetical protein [Enterococcus alcedinis]GGI64920.1 hypothetical protein GCM10011482_05740 [Enterococcus alcedinis]